MADEPEQFDNLKKVVSVGGTLEKLTIAQFCGHNRSNDHLNLVTIHSAKGLEFEAVILFGLEEGRLPKWSASDDEALQEQETLLCGIYSRQARSSPRLFGLVYRRKTTLRKWRISVRC